MNTTFLMAKPVLDSITGFIQIICIGSMSPPKGILRATIGSFLFFQLSAAETPNTVDIAALRVVRARCIEAFDSADTHLFDSEALLKSERELEAKSAKELLETNQKITALVETQTRLEQRQKEAAAQFLTTATTLDRVAASAQLASQILPDGKNFESAGTAALAELERLAQTDRQTDESTKEIQELKQNFRNAVKDWRDASLSFEQAKAELNVRGCESGRKGMVDQLDHATRVLEKSKPVLADIQGQMDSLRRDSDRWEDTLTKLRDHLQSVSESLSECRHQFHLADLAFATQVLQQPSDQMAANSPTEISLFKREILDITPIDSFKNEKVLPIIHSQGSQVMETRLPTMRDSDKRPANTAEIVTRTEIVTAKLKYLTEILKAEARSIRTALESFEKVGEEAINIEKEVSELSQNLESQRQALDRHRKDTAVGLGRLSLVQKRLESDDSALRASVAEATRQIADFNRLLGN